MFEFTEVLFEVISCEKWIPTLDGLSNVSITCNAECSTAFPLGCRIYDSETACESDCQFCVKFDPDNQNFLTVDGSESYENIEESLSKVDISIDKSFIFYCRGDERITASSNIAIITVIAMLFFALLVCSISLVLVGKNKTAKNNILNETIQTDEEIE